VRGRRTVEAKPFFGLSKMSTDDIGEDLRGEIVEQTGNHDFLNPRDADGGFVCCLPMLSPNSRATVARASAQQRAAPKEHNYTATRVVDARLGVTETNLG
jgi:hypothetical protein